MHHMKPAFSSGKYRYFELNASVLQHILVGRIFQAWRSCFSAFCWPSVTGQDAVSRASLTSKESEAGT